MKKWLTSWRFLLSRRWILFFVAILVVGYATWWLGEWQFGRLDERRDKNAVVEANEQDEPVPVEDVLSVGEPVDPTDEYRMVTAVGEYDVADTVVVRYRTDDEGAPGVDVVVPLVTESGAALLVDRGWFPTDDPRIDPSSLPAPPTGEVTVRAWVRADGTGDSTQVTDNSVRAISSVAIGDALDREVFGGFVELREESPEPAEPLNLADPPDLGEGPHFFYGLQWWFFGVLGLGGFAYLAWDERKHGRRGDRPARVKGTGPFQRLRDAED